MIHQKLWNLSLSMTSAFGAKYDLEIMSTKEDFWENIKNNEVGLDSEIIFGVPESQGLERAIRKEEISQFLGRFGVSSHKTFKVKIEELLQGSELNVLFDSIRGSLLVMPLQERAKLLKSIQHEQEKYIRYSVVAQYDKTLLSCGIRGFDIANGTSLCRLCTYLGYIDEEEMLIWLEQMASLAKTHFRSFKDYALSSTVGGVFWAGSGSDDAFLKNYYNCLQHPYSYWKHLTWDQCQ